jgi:uncharacterized protein YkwD/nucleoid-associated protein YgaU
MKKKHDDSLDSVLKSYRRRQQSGPFILWGLAATLLLVGIIVLVVWLTGPNKPKKMSLSLFATETPTPTLTSTPTMTPSPTSTATVTPTPTITLTPTPSAPFKYTIQEGESLATVAEQFNLGDNGILLILLLNPQIDPENPIVFVGQEITVPNPGMELPTATPIPPDLPRGTKVKYVVQMGDTLAVIAGKLNSTVEKIIEENDIENANEIFVGQVLVVPVNLVTPTPTRLPPTANPNDTPTPNAAFSPTPSGSAPCEYDENEDFVNALLPLINEARKNEGLPELTVNEKLSNAAMEHSIDMACNSLLSHTGSDGSTPKARVDAQNYKAALVIEDIYAQPPQYGGDAQAAFDWWMDDPPHRADLMNAEVTEIGIGYAYYQDSALGGYFTVVLAKPAP